MEQLAPQSVTPQWAPVIEVWAQRLSPLSRRRYARAMTRLAEFMGADSPEAAVLALSASGPAQASATIATWAQSMRSEGLAPATVQAFARTPVELFRLAQRLGAHPWTPVLPKLSSEQRHDRSGPPAADLFQLLRHVETASDPAALRDAAAIRLMSGAGLRRSEVSQLCIGDCDVNSSPAGVWVRRKGHQERSRVSIGPKTAAALVLLIAEHCRGETFDQAAADRIKLFPNGENLRLMLRRRAADAGIKSPVRPHGLRHTGATLAAQRGYDELIAFGGWKQPRHALRYMDEQEKARVRVMEATEL